MDLPWSDLRLVLAIARQGTLRGAAKALRISHPTVSRRMAELQESVDVRLFERHGRRLRLTAAGEDLAETAARIEVEVDGLERRIAGRDHRLEGLVRLAMSPAMFAAVAPALPRFADAHPGIELEILTGVAMSNLTRREADVAIRQTGSPQDTLVGRKLSQYQQAAYVHRSLATRLGDDAELWPWIDWDEAHAHHSSAVWLRDTVAPERVAARCGTALGLHQLVKAGLGVGFSPTMLAAPDPDLVRLDETYELPVFNRAIWVLTHADLRHTGRVRATMEWLSELLHVPGAGVWQGAGS